MHYLVSFFREHSFTAEYIHIENSIQTEAENSILLYSQYILRNNRVFLLLIVIMPGRRVMRKISPVSGIVSFF